MSDLTLFLAPRGVCAGIRETLNDYSERGLINDFGWVEPQMITPTQIKAVYVAAGRSSGTSLQGLAGTGYYTRLRLAVLVPAISGQAHVNQADSQRLVNLLESSFGGLPVLRARIIVTRAGEHQVLDSLAHDGWHNLVLAPEESAGPGLGHITLHPSSDPLDVGRHAAAGCAGVLGLWQGSTGSPLDDSLPLPGQNARLVRAFYRNLDTTEVEAALRSEVTAMDRLLPLPSRMGATATYIEDTSLATQTMADQLWTKHQGLLRGPRQSQHTQPTKAIGAWAALKMMFGFLWAAVKNAPRSWAQRLVHKVKSEAAATVHGIVFGTSNSQYTVIVNGISPTGQPASWLDVKDAATVLDKALDSGGVAPTHEPHADMSVLWQDFAAGALTLVDAGERVAAMPPVQIGAQLAIVKTSRSSVPPAAEQFDAIPPHLAAAVQLDSVKPFDVLGIYSLDERLQRAATDPNTGVSAGSTLTALRTWRRTHADNYATKVGTRIGQTLMETTLEVKTLLDAIRQTASADDVLNQVIAKQKKLAQLLKILLLVLVAALITVGVLTAFAVLGPTAAGVTALVLVLGWGVSTFFIFLSGQRELFRLLNERTSLLHNDEVNRKNLRHALRDLRRLGDAYGQFLSWSHIVGIVLNEPFGRADATGNGHTAYIQGLPLNIKAASAAVQPDAIGMAAAEIRRGIFNAGWLTKPWEATIDGAATQLGPKGYELRLQPQLIFKQQADGELSIMPEWIAALEHHGIDPAASAHMWAGVIKDLEGPLAGTAQSVLSTVHEAGGSAVPTPLAMFLAGVDEHSARFTGDTFDGAVLSDIARSAGKSSVELSVPFHSGAGLARRAGLVQLSAGIPEHDFRLFRTQASLQRSHRSYGTGPDRIDPGGQEDYSLPENFSF